MQRHWTMAWCIGLLTLVFSANSLAADASVPGGPTVLTIAGKIAQANRPAFDKFEDPFMAYHERSFATAYAFDRAMLESLGMHRATIAFAGWPRPVEVEGPRLRDVLAAAGAAPGTLNIVALDGFATDLSPGDLAAEDWIVAIKEGGRDLGIGQRDPAWVLYAPRNGPPRTSSADPGPSS
jgi:hypothetical protein